MPKELREKFPRLNKTLTSEECQEMVNQSLDILQDEEMKGSHNLFCDVLRIILALQLSVAETRFK